MSETEQYITDAECVTLNEARRVLDALSHRAFFDMDSQASGMVSALADAADSAVFNVLNRINLHGHQTLSHEQLFGSPA